MNQITRTGEHFGETGKVNVSAAATPKPPVKEAERNAVREWVYRPVIQTALTTFSAFGFRFVMSGLGHVPLRGGAVLAANHVSYFDFTFVGLTAHLRAKRLVRFLAKQAVFDTPVVGAAMRGMHHIPVDRANGGGAYRHAVAALRAGELVGVFPEATMSRSFTLRPFKSGAVRMARDAGVPLLPVICWGGQRVWTVGRRPELRRDVPVVIEVGAPMSDDPGVPLEEATRALRERMSGMLERVQRSYPDDGTGAWWAPAHLGGTAPSATHAAEAESVSIAGRRRARPGAQ